MVNPQEMSEIVSEAFEHSPYRRLGSLDLALLIKTNMCYSVSGPLEAINLWLDGLDELIRIAQRDRAIHIAYKLLSILVHDAYDDAVVVKWQSNPHLKNSLEDHVIINELNQALHTVNEFVLQPRD